MSVSDAVRRNTLQLDHTPTLHSVKEFVKVIQSEFDMLSLSLNPADSSKKPKLAAVQQQSQQQGQAGNGGKGKDNGGKGGEQKGKQKGGEPPPDGGAGSVTTEGVRKGGRKDL